MRIGVDLLSVSRFARVAEHHRYRALVFTEAELAEAGELGPRRRVERLAGRFCVKEATCKLLGRGFGQGLRWRDIEVTGDSWGAPVVTLSGGARQLAEEAGVHEIAVTLTHQVDLVVAVAVAVTAAVATAGTIAGTTAVATAGTTAVATTACPGHPSPVGRGPAPRPPHPPGGAR
ncbi:holo-ACP synthase [Kitasatospora sp. NBC_01287]|uniref:holo-ACP synthase n=1 Tax=Kitasatospora sp. NBC_01287 TaxID=2903573 RepID=UPI00224DE2F0|nr:holo-ACP synthase [Kitasatospora sp. NBC_01287]MCX4750465.1 holo-ACP synthase [Kitasatospora sp. NBC_01287]